MDQNAASRIRRLRMTQGRPPAADGLPPVQRRVVMLRLIRAFIYLVAFVVLYYVLPFDNLHNTGSVVVVIMALAGVVLMLWWQFHAVLRSSYPGLQAIEALATVVPLFLLVFATTYFLIEREAPGSFTMPLDRTDSVYFTVTTFSTVGYGDITPKTDATRIVVMIQMLANLAIIGFGVRALFSAVQSRREVVRGGVGGV